MRTGITNKDTISRQAAIDLLREEFKKSPTTAIRAMSAIKILPSAQPEIIRCKDCKHYDPNDHCYLQGAEADDFCSYAERREE